MIITSKIELCNRNVKTNRKRIAPKIVQIAQNSTEFMKLWSAKRNRSVKAMCQKCDKTATKDSMQDCFLSKKGIPRFKTGMLSCQRIISIYIIPGNPKKGMPLLSWRICARYTGKVAGICARGQGIIPEPLQTEKISVLHDFSRIFLAILLTRWVLSYKITNA